MEMNIIAENTNSILEIFRQVSFINGEKILNYANSNT